MFRICFGVAVVFVAANACAQVSSIPGATAVAPKAGTLFVYPERVALKDKGMFACQRGLLFVPVNRTTEDSDVIAVEFYRFPRFGIADSETPPIFMLNGGPGFPGLEPDLNEPGTLEKRFFHLLNVSDVIVVGQRGIGSSKPNTVVEQYDESGSHEAYDDARAVAEFQKSLSRERQFWINQGLDLSGFNVLECAADVHDLATALGIEKVTLYGGSFGSHWAMAIMRTYPDLVARSVLSGLEGPDHTWDHPGWIWNVYKRVAAEAEAAESLKGLIPEGGLIAAVESLVEEAGENPREVTLFRGRRNEATAIIDRRAMQYVARGISRRLKDWPAEVIQMSNGNFANAAVATLMRKKKDPRSFKTASYWALDSSSGISQRRRSEIESDPATAILGNINWSYAAGSPVWKVDLGDDFRKNTETKIPTVIVHGTWDTQTPYENALELALYFKEHKFVTVERGSHGAINEAQALVPGFRRSLLHFIESGDSSRLPDKITLPAPRWTVPK